MDEPRPLPRPAWRDQPGHLGRIFRTPHAVLDNLSARHGPIYALGIGPVRLAIVGDPDAVREFFAMPNTSFRWNHQFNVLGFVVGQDSTIVSDGEDHRRRRSSVQTAFSRRRLNGWIPMIVEQTDVAIDRLTERLGPRSIIDMYPIGRALVLQIVVRSLFGDRMIERCGEIGHLFQRPQDHLESSAFHQLPHPFPHTARARVRADRLALDVIIDAEIADRRAHPSDDPLDVLATLVTDSLRGPIRFDPDRFIDRDDEQRALADMAWVPFGGGARNCIGFALAQMELTLIVARLAQRLDLTPVVSEIPVPVGMVVNRPAGGAPMRIRARKSIA